jgi:hypothetical protein
MSFHQKHSNTQISILYSQDTMQFSLKLVAAAAFLLPNLIAARAVPNNAVAKQEAFASPEAKALSNFEVTRHDFESGIKAAQVKRDAYAEAIAQVESVTSHQLVTRGEKEDLVEWNAIRKAYKSQGDIYEGLSKGWNEIKDPIKKAADLVKVIAALKA